MDGEGKTGGGEELRQRGDGGHPIHVIVPEDEYLFLRRDRPGHPFHRLVHVRDEEWIVEIGETRDEETAGGGGNVIPPRGENPGRRRRKAEFARESLPPTRGIVAFQLPDRFRHRIPQRGREAATQLSTKAQRHKEIRTILLWEGHLAPIQADSDRDKNACPPQRVARKGSLPQ